MEDRAELGVVLDPLFRGIADGTYQAVVSVVTLLEVLIAPLRARQTTLAQQYRDLLMRAEGLTLAPVTPAVAEEGASIRAESNLRVPDALIAATATTEGCLYLIANDAHFTLVPRFRTLIVSDFAG
jgi:predicted nucleic acid-binding protein